MRRNSVVGALMIVWLSSALWPFGASSQEPSEEEQIREHVAALAQKNPLTLCYAEKWLTELHGPEGGGVELGAARKLLGEGRYDEAMRSFRTISQGDLPLLGTIAYAYIHRCLQKAGNPPDEQAAAIREGLEASVALAQENREALWLPAAAKFAVRLAGELENPTRGDIAAAKELTALARASAQLDPKDGLWLLADCDLLLASLCRKNGMWEQGLAMCEEVRRLVDMGQIDYRYLAGSDLEAARILLASGRRKPAHVLLDAVEKNRYAYKDVLADAKRLRQTDDKE